MKTLPLFDLGEPLPKCQAIPHERRCIPAGAQNGRGPATETCGTCRHLCRVRHRAGFYLKCGLAQAAWTHGAGSDIFAGWPACEQWEAASD